MSASGKAAGASRVQYAALPYRLRPRRSAEVMLVTSRDTQRWIIPKGWPHKGKAPHDSAAREAFEEAGVLGVVEKRSVGSFRYAPEKDQREVKWLLRQRRSRIGEGPDPE
jgi:8-oxo-dGTP pyrophosphatase MutT (NUDIX family)